MLQTLLDLGANEISKGHYVITTQNNVAINVEKDVEHNGNIWAWKVETQIFSKDDWAANYLKKIIAEKITGIRIINRKRGTVPDICGIEGAACRQPGKCDRMLCSHCPVAEKFFADRDGVRLIYAAI